MARLRKSGQWWWGSHGHEWEVFPPSFLQRVVSLQRWGAGLCSGNHPCYHPQVRTRKEIATTGSHVSQVWLTLTGGQMSLRGSNRVKKVLPVPWRAFPKRGSLAKACGWIHRAGSLPLLNPCLWRARGVPGYFLTPCPCRNGSRLQSAAALWVRGQPGPHFIKHVWGCFSSPHCLITWPNNPGGVWITSGGCKVWGSRSSLANGGSQRRRRARTWACRRDAQERGPPSPQALPAGAPQTDGKLCLRSRGTEMPAPASEVRSPRQEVSQGSR